jgi:oligopeptide/dipeptide ABC transporter ATP-binding protein
VSSEAAEHDSVVTEPQGLMSRLRGRTAAGERTPIQAADLHSRPRAAAEPSAGTLPSSAALLEVRDLSVEYLLESSIVNAVDRVSFSLKHGEFLAVVGESGCGKSTLLFAIAKLLSPPAEITGGSVLFRGRNMVGLTDSALTAIRWKDLSVVMQSAMNALNPVKTIGAQFQDAMRAHGTKSKEEIGARSAEVLRMVGIDPVHLNSYPHQLSGGMRQRSMIAMALLFTPELVIMDEPTSALDVVAQRSLMVQIKELQETFGFAVIFVTHDMSLVSHFSDHLMVMYAGQVAELGPTQRLFDSPAHPYTVGLMDAFPSIRGPRRPLEGIPGRPPDLARPPSGCRFAPRCPKVMERCTAEPPSLYPLDGINVRCFLYDPASQVDRGSTS